MDPRVIPQVLEIIEDQETRLLDAQSRKGQRPEKQSQADLVAQFAAQLTMNDNTDSAVQIRASFLPPAYPPSVAPLSDLEQIMIDDLRLETHHRGRYILLRTVTPLRRDMAVHAIVEDETGDGTPLQLFNQDPHRTPEDILPEGAVLIVKEPYLRGIDGIRVDHVSDVILLPGYDKRVPEAWKGEYAGDSDVPAGEWKKAGNTCFHQSKYHKAIQLYTQGLESSPTPEEADTLRLNRSLVFLKTDQFDAALSDIGSLPESVQSSEKALARKSQVLYQLQRFRECCDTLKALRIAYPNNNPAKVFLTRAIQRLAEQQTGRYKFRQLYDEASSLRPPHLDRATYIGPVVVKPCPDETRGRGLFTTRAVKAGELLLCEKAFAYVFIDDENPVDSSGDCALLVNPDTKSVTVGSESDLIPMIVQKMHRNPGSAMKTFTDLSHGSYRSVDVSEVDGRPVVDSFLVERIVHVNSFGNPLTTREWFLRAKTEVERNQSQDRTRGIWITPSYINHHCDSNACRSFIGDMLILRASRDIDANAEITIVYRLPDDDADDDNKSSTREQRQTQIGKLSNWDFQCDCALCVENRRLVGSAVFGRRKSLIAERERLARLWLTSRRVGNGSLANMERTVAALVETYARPTTDVPRGAVAQGQLALASRYIRKDQPGKAVQWALSAFESLGYVIQEEDEVSDGGGKKRTLLVKRWGLVMDVMVNGWMILAMGYGHVAPELEGQAREYAKIQFAICVGESETMDDCYP